MISFGIARPSDAARLCDNGRFCTTPPHSTSGRVLAAQGCDCCRCVAAFLLRYVAARAVHPGTTLSASWGQQRSPGRRHRQWPEISLWWRLPIRKRG